MIHKKNLVRCLQGFLDDACARLHNKFTANLSLNKIKHLEIFKTDFYLVILNVNMSLTKHFFVRKHYPYHL